MGMRQVHTKVREVLMTVREVRTGKDGKSAEYGSAYVVGKLNISLSSRTSQSQGSKTLTSGSHS